ncbi:MAG: HDIG domain-containing protein [Firmicutes bacterium]|nr:HDIG domain-containing protein [Bacillota bacterium]
MKRKNRKSWKKIRNFITEKTSVRQWLLGLSISVGILAVLIFNALPTGVSVEVGQVAKKDLAAPVTAVNTNETARLEEEAERQVLLEVSKDPGYYDLNQSVILEVEEDLTGIFNLLRLSIPQDTDVGEEDEGQEAADVDLLSTSEVDRRLIRDWKIEIPENVLQAVAAMNLQEFDQFAQGITNLVLAAMEERISEDELRDARNSFETSVEAKKLKSELEQGATIIGRHLIQPNLILNTEKVNKARQAAAESVEPALIMQGEVIVRKGDVVREEHIGPLRDVGLIKTGLDYGLFVGLVLLVASLMSIFGTFLYQNRPDILKNERLLALVGSVLLVMLFLGKLFTMIGWAQAPYLNPSALTGLLLTLLIGFKVASMSTAVLAVFLVVINDFSWSIGIMTLVSGFTAILSVSKVSQRGDLMRAGFIIGGVNFLTMVTLGLVGKENVLVLHSYLGLLSGVLASIVAIGILPYLESVFKITSAIRLLELSNPNHPLLRRLMLEAPGTYHHSILVGNLAEAAAEAIGADGLLARVGSHYHDIGKLKRPYFFVENQVGIDNPHDKIAPSLSTLIITSHVKDGIELAQEFKLPRAVTQFISEHHGTDLVRFFYHRASEANDDGSVKEKDYRYPGPKHQTREVAIVSLADATEAAVRSLGKPNPGKIEGLVRKIIKDRLNSGELDESELTFQDLDKIASAFVKVIVGMFHSRVEYPEQITKEEVEGKRTRNGGSSK